MHYKHSKARKNRGKNGGKTRRRKLKRGGAISVVLGSDRLPINEISFLFLTFGEQNKVFPFNGKKIFVLQLF
jgi:hypothetical protein